MGQAKAYYILMDRPKNASLEGRARCQMIKEEGNGVEAGGPTPAGAFVYPSAGKVKPARGESILAIIKDGT